MNKKKNYCVRLDEDLIIKAQDLFTRMGTNMTSAITMFLLQSVREERFPFTPTLVSPYIREFADLDAEELF